ncbi:hypothetical protein [Botryobacter ruber]|uniref:hypothetical protein n=1 Tax=Botryobacter ruber TaxID=2171629 RepID=UPI000E0CADF4|nr:hypothetical protein [Botryobacter ruber]
MELDDLKTNWQKAGAAAGAADKLTQIIKTGKHLTVVRKVRLKLLTEAVFMVLLLFFFYDIFDGDQKPAYASIALVVGALFYFLSNLLGYFTLLQVVREQQILTSLQQLLNALKRMKVFSLAAMLLFSLSLLVFFTSAVELTLKKWLMVAAFGCFVGIQAFFSMRMWNNWIGRIRQQVEELAE